MNKFVLEDGRELTISEMSAVSRYYRIQCISEYLHENMSIDEEGNEKIAYLVYSYMNKVNCSESEAITEVMTGILKG